MRADKYKYNKLISELRRRIAEGGFDKEGKLPTERALCELFQYSRNTIRSALQELKDEGVIRQQQGCGTFILKPETKVSSGMPEKRFVCCCFECDYPLEEDPYYGQLFQGVQQAMTHRGNIVMEYKAFPRDIDFGEFILSGEIDIFEFDGFIFAGPRPGERTISRLNDAGVRFVMLGESDSPRCVPTVRIDNFSAAYQAVRHLNGIGRRAILYLDRTADPWWSFRECGYRTALEEAGMPFRREMILPVNSVISRTDAVEVLEKTIAAGIVFDAAIVVGDWTMVGVIETLRKHNRSVPEDVALISQDGFPWMLNAVKPALTRLTSPFVRMGRKALEMLLDLQNETDGDIPVEIITPQLVLRESTHKKQS